MADDNIPGVTWIKRKYRQGKNYKPQKSGAGMAGKKKNKMRSGFVHNHKEMTLVVFAGTGKKRFMKKEDYDA